jgi:hypothetical protein
MPSIFALAAQAASIGQGAGLFNPIMRAAEYTANAVHPNRLPDEATIVDAWRAGNLPNIKALSALRLLGVTPPRELEEWRVQEAARDPNNEQLGAGIGFDAMWSGVWESRVQIPQVGDLLAACNLGLINDSQYHRILQRAGWWWEPYRQLELDLSRNRIPEPAELVSFALREAWDPATVARFQYDAEFPPEFKFWMEKLGYRGDARVKVDGVPQGPPVSWSDLYWRVHWANISPTQAYEMYQRLRPDRVARFGADFRNMRPFTFDDLTRVLKINDYPVPFREQLAAIAYRLPRLVDIDRFFRTNQIDRGEVYQLHLDLGYNPTDAEMRTRWLETEKQKSLLTKGGANPTRSILSLYQNGLLDRAQAAQRLYDAIHPEPLPEGNPAWIRWRANRGAAEHDNEVALLLNSADMKALLQEAKEVQSAVKSQFLHGYTDAQTAEKNLRDAGFSQSRVARLMERWRRQLASGHLLLSTSKIRELVVKGILPLDAASGYLANLGWAERERRYLIAEIQRDWDLEQERITERQARTEQSRSASQARQARLLEAERRRVVKQMNQQATATQLRKYAVRGIISFAEFELELKRRGFDERSIKRQIQDATIDRAKWIAKNRGGFASTISPPANDRSQLEEETQMP